MQTLLSFCGRRGLQETQSTLAFAGWMKRQAAKSSVLISTMLTTQAPVGAGWYIGISMGSVTFGPIFGLDDRNSNLGKGCKPTSPVAFTHTAPPSHPAPVRSGTDNVCPVRVR